MLVSPGEKRPKGLLRHDEARLPKWDPVWALPVDSLSGCLPVGVHRLLS